MSSALVSHAPLSDLDAVVDLVQARPGLSRAAAARSLGGRRATALERLARAAAAGLVHEAPSAAAIRGGATRTVAGLFPGPAPAADVLPGLEPAALAATELDGARLRRDRLRAGVPATVLADHLGVSRAQLYRWETGRQPIPPRHELHRALEAAQTAVGHPERRVPRGNVSAVRALVQAVRRSPGRSRYALVGRSQRRAALLDVALAQGLVHLAPAWGRGTRQRLVGIYPGGAPARRDLVLMDNLHRARLEAGWSQPALAGRLGVARTTVARWEREVVVVPGWAAEAAARALVEARAVRRDDQGAVLAAITAAPGSSRKAILATLGYSRSPTTQGHIDALLAAGAVHERHAGRRGQASGLYPGAAPVQVLTGEQLQTLRDRAGLRQRDVADRVGVGVQAMGDWEAGTTPMTAERQEQLRTLLAGLPDAGRRLQDQVVELVREQPRTRHQLELLHLASRGDVDHALQALLDAGRIHVGRVGAGLTNPRRPGRVSCGRGGYVAGPARK